MDSMQQYCIKPTQLLLSSFFSLLIHTQGQRLVVGDSFYSTIILCIVLKPPFLRKTFFPKNAYSFQCAVFMKSSNTEVFQFHEILNACV